VLFFGFHWSFAIYLRSARRDLVAAAAGSATGETALSILTQAMLLEKIVAALRQKARLIRFTSRRGHLIVPR
jgi:hypothetical protein